MRSHQRRRWAALASTLTLLGCSTSEDSVQPGVDAASIRAMSVSYEDDKLFFDVRQRLIEACMAQRGFDVPSVAFGPPSLYATGEKRWGLPESDLDSARVHGYHLPRDPALIASEERAAAETEFLAGLSADERERYWQALTDEPVDGAPRPSRRIEIEGSDLVIEVTNSFGSNGCAVQADDELFGSRDQYLATLNAVQKLRSEIDQRATASEAFQAVIKNWSECFEDLGYEAADPLDANDRYVAPGDTPSAEELEAAVADIECKRKLGFEKAWSAAVEEAIGNYDDELASAVPVWLEMKARALAEATRITAEGWQRGRMGSGLDYRCGTPDVSLGR